MQIKNLIALGAVSLTLVSCGGSITEINPGSEPRVFFAFDSSEITSDANDVLLGQALYMKNNPDVNVVIEGHCDARGTTDYNLALGHRRANASKSVMVKDGVESARIQTVSYGKEKPWVAGSGEDVWAQNRNTKTVVK